MRGRKDGEGRKEDDGREEGDFEVGRKKGVT